MTCLAVWAATPAEIGQLVMLLNRLADFGRWFCQAGLFKRNLRLGVFNFFDNIADDINVHLAPMEIEAGADVLTALAVITAPRRPPELAQ